MEDEFKFLEGKILSSRIYPEFFPLHQNDRIINLGCGEGPQAVIYKGQFREMAGVDINPARLQKFAEAMHRYGVKNCRAVCADVEQAPFPDETFDKALAVDIIEHVQDPGKFLREAHRLLKNGGELLITFPAMHDVFTRLVSFLGRVILGKKKPDVSFQGWDADAHNQEYPLQEWVRMVERHGFTLYKSRATTLFPPLHLYGVPKFWFRSEILHAVDNFFCTKPIFKYLGQSLMCVFIKD